MSENRRWAGIGCLVLVGIVVGVPLLVVGVVGVKTWVPLHGAGESMAALDRSLGAAASYRPAPSGAIPADRMELFLAVRASLVEACGEYGEVQRGFDAVDSLETRDPADPGEVGDVAVGLGGAALAITPFLARYFERRNAALLEASMGLEEYAYIYATAYHDQLLADRTRREIFSDGDALSPEASSMLRECLARQLADMDPVGAELATELRAMEADPSRLVWQDGLPDTVRGCIAPYRARLDDLFCPATAGLEMDRSARRALKVALE